MRKRLLSQVLAMVMAGSGLAAGLAAPAAAHPCRPYLIERICDADRLNCRSHMHYTPGHNPMHVAPDNYFYAMPGFHHHHGCWWRHHHWG